MSDHYAAPCKHCQLLEKTFKLFNEMKPTTGSPAKELQEKTPIKSDIKGSRDESAEEWDFSNWFDDDPETSFADPETSFAAPETSFDGLFTDQALTQMHMDQ